MTERTSRMGTLYGIGVGPGDPDLIPVKAVKILQKVRVVFAASSTKNDHSRAISIAGSHIPESVEIRNLAFPMTLDRNKAEKAWISHAETIVEELYKGNDVAFLTLGDTMTYSTYNYIVPHVQSIAPGANIVTIPGITSYQAAAARLNKPLVEGEESLLVLSGAKGGDRLRHFGKKTENVVLLKAYKNVVDIIEALDECELGSGSVGVSHCGSEDEEIIEDIHQLGKRNPGYWTLIISKKNRPDEKR